MTPSPMDLALAMLLADEVDATNGQCWLNAFHAMQTETAQDAGLLYVEGWAVSHEIVPIPMEHAWLEHADGRVVDPTPTYYENTKRRYFAARRFTMEQMLTAALQYEAFPLTCEGDGILGLRFPVWRHAYLRAHVWGMGRESTRWMTSVNPKAYTSDDMAVVEAAEEYPTQLEAT